MRETTGGIHGTSESGGRGPVARWALIKADRSVPGNGVRPVAKA